MDTQHTVLVDHRVSGRTSGVSQLQVSASAAEIQQCQFHMTLLRYRPTPSWSKSPGVPSSSVENVDQFKVLFCANALITQYQGHSTDTQHTSTPLDRAACNKLYCHLHSGLNFAFMRVLLQIAAHANIRDGLSHGLTILAWLDDPCMACTSAWFGLEHLCAARDRCTKFQINLSSRNESLLHCWACRVFADPFMFLSTRCGILA